MTNLLGEKIFYRGIEYNQRLLTKTNVRIPFLIVDCADIAAVQHENS